jgi:arsenate reductase
MKVEVYHNPRCSKSREAVNYLKEEGHEVEIIEYLKVTPTRAELEMLLAKLNLRPHNIIRTGELIYKEHFRGKDFNDDEWIDILMEHPKLIERPIVIRGNKAVIGRPFGRVVELIETKKP